MNKIIAEVYVPIAKKKYDVLLPEHILMSEALTLISKMVSEMSDGLFASDDNTIICNRVDGSVINLNMTVKELGLLNGSKLMLI